MSVEPSEDAHELLVNELGMITSELAAERRLTAMVAHDMASPVQVIVGLSELLLEHHDLDPGVRRRVEQILRSAEGIGSLVGDLQLGLPPSSSTHLDLEEMDLAEVARALVERSRLLANAKQMQLEITVDRSLGRCTVNIDRPRLDRALSNLLGNAIKFGPAGSTVRLAVARLGDMVRLVVADDGPGIDAESAESVFEVFHREERTAHLPGLGLGLYITRQIVEAHRGSVAVDSGVSSGAAFVVHLPLAPSQRHLASVREN